MVYTIRITYQSKPTQVMLKKLTLSLFKIPEYTALLFALLSVAAFLFVILMNLHYPFGFGVVQWHIMESIQRAYSGLPIYIEPSLDYIPDLYTPFYYYVVALLSHIIGLDLFTGKLVTLSAVLGTGTVTFLWLRKEQTPLIPSLLGASVFFAMYGLYDLRNYQVRVDGLFCFLLITGFYVLYCYRTQLTAVIAGTLLCLAVYTKQSAIIAIIPVLAVYWHCVPTQRRYYVTGTFLLLCGVAFFALNIASDWWFWYYTVDVPSDHDLVSRQWLGFFSTMGKFTWPVIVLSVIGFLIALRTKGVAKQLPYIALFLGLWGCSYSMRLHVGGERNTLMPACIALSLFAPMVFCYFDSKHESLKKAAIYASLMLLFALQFFMYGYNPHRFIPQEHNIIAAQRYLDYLGNIEGDILVEGGGFYPTRKNQRTYSINTSLWDIMRAHNEYIKEKLDKEYQDAVRQQKFAAIITYYPNPDRRYIRYRSNYKINESYEFKEKIGDHLWDKPVIEYNVLRNTPLPFFAKPRPRFRSYSQSRYVFIPKDKPSNLDK